MAELRTTSLDHVSEFLRGLVTGLAGGLVESVVMDAFQSLASPLLSRLQGDSGQGGSELTTVRAAEAVSEDIFGHQLSGREKEMAGPVVHYATGIALGGIYGMVAVLEPRVTIGAGLPFGASVAAVLHEALAPAIGLSGPPWQAPAPIHAYLLASNLVFGLMVEVVRRGVSGLLGPDRPSRAP
jgi:hypothetical protein